MRTFYLPTRPYSVIDCINRVSLATGSIGNAERGADVDYNGHHVYFVEPNQFKRYWTCGYTWAGSHTIGRGSLAECLEAAKREYDRGALGASASLTVESDEDAATCIAAGFKEGKDDTSSWFGPMHAEVWSAKRYTEQCGVSATSFLANSKTVEEYKEKLEAALAERRRPLTSKEIQEAVETNDPTFKVKIVSKKWNEKVQYTFDQVDPEATMAYNKLYVDAFMEGLNEGRITRHPDGRTTTRRTSWVFAKKIEDLPEGACAAVFFTTKPEPIGFLKRVEI